jgi:hypothetical protein
LSALKKQVIQELPGKACPHCSTVYGRKSFVETDDGEIVAYCKRQGNEEEDRGKKYCGRSNVFFTLPSLVEPVYEKFCVFKAASTPETNSASGQGVTHSPSSSSSSSAEAEAEAVSVAMVSPGSGAPMDQGPVPQGYDRSAPLPNSSARPVHHAVLVREVEQRMSRMDVYELHGVTRPSAECATCGKAYSEHRHDVDANGWAKIREKAVRLPSDWPSLPVSLNALSHNESSQCAAF